MKKKSIDYYAIHFPVLSEYDLDRCVSKYKLGQCYENSNFMIFKERAGTIYISTAHVFSKGHGEWYSEYFHNGYYIHEQNRYVFSSEGYHRYVNHDGIFKPSRWRSPAFTHGCDYYYAYKTCYQIFDIESLAKSKFFEYFKYTKEYPLDYDILDCLKFIYMHPNAEYLMKQGFSSLVWDESKKPVYVNWGSNNLKTMLHLNKNELKILQENKLQSSYWKYIGIRDSLNLKPEMIIKAFCFAGAGEITSTLAILNNHRHVSATKLVSYIYENGINVSEYKDYISQCIELEYNLCDSMYMFPRNFDAMHARCTQTLLFKEEENKLAGISKMDSAVARRIPSLKALEFEWEDLIVVIPQTAKEIYIEGKVLNHCVGGYIERHSKGILNIVFLRNKNKPDVPYYTMEISNEYEIVQCRGFRNNKANNPKPQHILDFEQAYENYLSKIRRSLTA